MGQVIPFKLAIQDRWYQTEASDAVIMDILFSEEKINPLVVAPAGTGKSIIPCKIIDEFLSKYPEKNVLVMADTENIVEQNHAKLSEFFEGIRIGIYNAAIGLKIIEKITVAGIQSCHRTPKIFGDVGLIIVDEAHKITKEQKGMYRKFFKNYPDVPIVGLTASPWNGRTHLTEVKDPIFNKVSYDISKYHIYNQLISEGYLVPLIPLPTDYNLDEDGIPIVDGDFDELEMSKRFDQKEVTEQICKRIVKYGKKYKCWLVFAIDKAHAEHIAQELIRLGVKAEALYSGSERSKLEVIEDLRRGDLRAVVNVGMMTTGVDVPQIDLIAHCRLTRSPNFHVQTNGRGPRPLFVDGYDLSTIEGRLASIKASGKTHCLVLDFALNTKRLGPINGMEINDKVKGKGVKSIMAKSCKNCGTDNHLRALQCIACDEEFVFETKLKVNPDTTDIIKKNKEEVPSKEAKWYDVTRMSYSTYFRASDSMQMFVAKHHCKMLSFDKYVALDHNAWMAKRDAEGFVNNRWGGDIKNKPRSVQELYENRHLLKTPSRIKITIDEKGFTKFLDTEFVKGQEFDDLIKPSSKNNLSTFKALYAQAPKMVDFDDDIPF